MSSAALAGGRAGARRRGAVHGRARRRLAEEARARAVMRAAHLDIFLDHLFAIGLAAGGGHRLDHDRIGIGAVAIAPAIDLAVAAAIARAHRRAAMAHAHLLAPHVLAAALLLLRPGVILVIRAVV